MTVKNWDANGGTDGTNVTIANSDTSGDAIGTIVINSASVPGGGTAIQYLTDAASEGACGVRIIPQAGNTHLRWVDTSPTTMKNGARFRFRLNGSAIDSAVATLFNVRSSADVNIYDVQITTSRVLFARNRTYATFSGQTYVLTMGVWYEIEAYVLPDTSSTGNVNYKLYLAGETTPLVTFTSGGNDDLGTVQPAQLRLGCTTTSTTSLTSIDYDLIRFGSLPTEDEWGPTGTTSVDDAITGVAGSQGVAGISGEVSGSSTSTGPAGSMGITGHAGTLSGATIIHGALVGIAGGMGATGHAGAFSAAINAVLNGQTGRMGMDGRIGVLTAGRSTELLGVTGTTGVIGYPGVLSSVIITTQQSAETLTAEIMRLLQRQRRRRYREDPAYLMHGGHKPSQMDLYGR